MTDQPGREPEQRLPARRPPSEPAPAERFSAPPSAHRNDLTPERAAQIVRQSSSARWIGFLTVLVVVLFVVAYYFYELVGLPFVTNQPRLLAEGDAQQVTAVERGYNLYEANCARCHGTKGEGGIGPVLNDQAKLYLHLNETYLKNVLTVGGRYVCGNPNSLMPVWSNENGGPLNYRQIEDLIAFLRAPNTGEYEVRDPALNEPTGQTFNGWRDPNYKPAPGSTPVPDCWSKPAASGGAGGSASPAPSGSAPVPSGSAAAGTTLELTAQGIAWDTKELSATAGQAFKLHFVNKDAGVPHDVEIRAADGSAKFTGQQLSDAGETTYDVPALAAGTYTYICTIHPIPAMTGTLTVK
jgi:plastocyanin/mono/diheme cytochrome c family protein